MTDSLEKFEYELSCLDSTSFRFRPKNNDALELGCSLVDLFESFSEEDRIIARKSINLDRSKKLLSLSSYMAESAVNLDAEKLVRCAIGLHVIEDISSDYRENIRYLILVNYAADHIGASLRNIFSSLSYAASDRASKFFSGFFSRDPSLNELQKFYVKAENIDGELRFVPLKI